MAKIVVGIGTPHSPLASLPGKYWRMQGDNEMKNPGPIRAAYGGGEVEELKRIREPKLKNEVTEERQEEKFQAAQLGVGKLRKALVESGADVLVTIADDQQNLFFFDHMPAYAIYRGETIKNPKVDDSRPVPEFSAAARWGTRPLTQDEEYPNEPELADHLIKSLVSQEFDVSYLTEPREGRFWAGGFTFVNRRLMPEGSLPMVPFMLNTYYPPNSPTAKRCWDLGKALFKAIDSWDSNKTVCVVPSGGLTHPIVDEELDRRCLDAMVKNDYKTLTSIEEDVFVLGTSEIKNWIVGASCLQEAGLKMNVIDYIPGYRSVVATGCGMAFADWH
ncbi:MAG: Protocatechuate 4,5-dioxygenase beta chain [Nitrospira sp.]|nr:Protocatechuate 4,5-dioxygenase beta chain [Nitrospira sp.]